MLGIIIEILKWLGIAVLVILGLILAVLLTVLLIPIRYEGEGSCYGKLFVRAGVSWFFHLFSFQMIYENELETVVKIFGLPIGKKEKASEPETVSEPEQASEPKKSFVEEKTVSEPKKASEPEKSFVEEKMASEPEKHSEPKKRSEPKKSVKQEKALKSKTSSFHPWKKIKATWEQFCGKLKGAADKWQRFRDFLENEENRKTFRLLKKQFICLLKHILPGTFSGKIRFGFDDPYKTGTVLTYISPFYGLYGDKIQVIPVFDEAVMEGELFFKGRIRIATLLWIGFQVWRDKNFRTLLRKWQAA